MAEANQTEQATPRPAPEGARKRTGRAQPRSHRAASGMAAVFVLFALLSSFPLAWRGFFRDCLEFSMKDGAISGNLRMDALPPSGATPDSSSPWRGAGLGWVAALSSALAQGGRSSLPPRSRPTFHA